MYRKAAKQGDACAQYWLGEMYRDGEGVVQDLVMAYVGSVRLTRVGSKSPQTWDLRLQVDAIQPTRQCDFL
jgi:hypothetical protein